MPRLWRIQIRPTGSEYDPAKSYAFCLRKEVIGVGGVVNHDGPLAIEHYSDLYDAEYTDGEGKKAATLLAGMMNGDFVWMRNTQGVYHLCKVIGFWMYDASPEARSVDLVNQRHVEIAEVGVESHVPGKVIDSFKTARAIQRINDDTTLVLSILIWNKLADRHEWVPHLQTSDIFTLITAKDCEDLISAYLQMQGWLVFPARRRSDTVAYEFVLRHRTDFREAVVQVKAGNSIVDLGALPSAIDRAFVFHPNGQYRGKNPKAVVISRDDVLDFISTNPRLVPDAASYWSSFVRPLRGSQKPSAQPIRRSV